MDQLVKKFISMKNNVANEFVKRHPLLGKVRAKVSDNKRFGLKFVNENDVTMGEYTVITSGNYITAYEKGISNAFLSASMKVSLLEEMLEYENEFYTHPVKATAKVMKMYTKALAKGDAKIYRG